MSYPEETNTAGQRFYPTPYQSGPMRTGMINGVWLNDGEEVEWSWMHTTQGSYVNGYTVKSKLITEPPNVYGPLPEEKCFRIIGKHTGKVIGHCVESEKENVLKEEPDVTFEECDKMESNDDD